MGHVQCVITGRAACVYVIGNVFPEIRRGV